MSMRIDTVAVPPPPPRVKIPRLTDKMKSLPPGSSFVSDYETVRCFRAWCYYNGLQSRIAKVGETTWRVWRIT